MAPLLFILILIGVDKDQRPIVEMIGAGLTIVGSAILGPGSCFWFSWNMRPGKIHLKGGGSSFDHIVKVQC